jgi:hypothetical protein
MPNINTISAGIVCPERARMAGATFARTNLDTNKD